MISPYYTVTEGRSILVLGTAKWTPADKDKALTHKAASENDAAAIEKALSYLHIEHSRLENQFTATGHDAEKLARVIETRKFTLNTPKAIIKAAGPWQDASVSEKPRGESIIVSRIPIGNLTSAVTYAVKDALYAARITHFTDHPSELLGPTLRIYEEKNIEQLHLIDGMPKETVESLKTRTPLTPEHYKKMRDTLIIGTANVRQNGHILMIDETLKDEKENRLIQNALDGLGIAYTLKSDPEAGRIKEFLNRRSTKPKIIVIDEKSFDSFKNTIQGFEGMTPEEIVQAGGTKLQVRNGFAHVQFGDTGTMGALHVQKALEEMNIEIFDDLRPSNISGLRVSGNIEKLQRVLEVVPYSAITAQRNGDNPFARR